MWIYDRECQSTGDKTQQTRTRLYESFNGKTNYQLALPVSNEPLTEID